MDELIGIVFFLLFGGLMGYVLVNPYWATRIIVKWYDKFGVDVSFRSRGIVFVRVVAAITMSMFLIGAVALLFVT